jgi:hypothetical protein
MDDPEKSNWWTENEGTRRAVAIASLLALALAVFLLWSNIKDFLWVHPWWQSVIASLPAIALVILAYRELCHSSEANALRHRANDLREEANDLQRAHTAELVRQFDIQLRENNPITKAFRAVQEKEARTKMGLEPESAEYRRLAWLDVLRREYISSHDNISPAIVAGTELPPREWLNERIIELNKAFKNQGKALLPLVEDNSK